MLKEEKEKNYKTTKIEIELEENEIELLSKVYQSESLEPIEDSKEELLTFLQKISNDLSQRAFLNLEDISKEFFPIRTRYQQNRYLIEKFPNCKLFEYDQKVLLKRQVTVGLSKGEGETIKENREDMIDPQVVISGEVVRFITYMDDSKNKSAVSKRINNERYLGVIPSKYLDFVIN